MGNIERPALIEEWKQILDATNYEKNMNKDVRLPSNKKIIDRTDRTKYCQTGLNSILIFL